MEREHKFSEGNQEEGEERTARYISNTYTYHMVSKQLNQIPETEKEERKELEKVQANILDKIEELHQNSLVKEFLQSRREEEERRAQGRLEKKRKKPKGIDLGDWNSLSQESFRSQSPSP